MAIIKHSYRSPSLLTPWREFGADFNRLSRLFDEGPFFTGAEGMWSPAVSIAETNEDIEVTAEVPGLTGENINVELENNVLTISGEKTEERTEGDSGERRYHLWERSYGSFRRSFTLPSNVDTENVEADFENGILHVRLPKAMESKGRRIEISKSGTQTKNKAKTKSS